MSFISYNSVFVLLKILFTTLVEVVASINKLNHLPSNNLFCSILYCHIITRHEDPFERD